MALPPSEFRMSHIQSIEEKLHNWYASSANIVQLKSQVRWLEEGERCTAYFFNRYRRRREQADISQISAEPFGTTSEAVCHFYQNLYQDNGEDNQGDIDTFLDLSLPTLSSDASQDLSKSISEEEVCSALQSTRTNTAPGPDGIPYTWYRANIDLLAGPLASLFNQVLSQGVVPPSWRKTFIKLIPKGSQNKEQVNNWRPIALITVTLSCSRR